MRTTLAIFLLTALALAFAQGTVHYVGPSDEAVYLTLARDGGRLYDGAPYVIHPPAYPLAIRAATLPGLGYERASMVVGIVACAGLVALLHRLVLAVSGSELAALVAALGLASSRVLAFTAQGAFREPLEVLLLWATLHAIVTAPEKPDRTRLVLVSVLGALGALTFDPLGVAAPLFVVVGVLARRRAPGIAAALAGTVVWLAWALYRAHLMGAADTYPAGIDGMVEDTRPLSLLGFVNPNFLPETARHNAFWWPTRLSPESLVALVGPALLAAPSLVLDFVARGTAHDLVAGLWLGLAGLGLALGTPGKGRSLAALTVPTIIIGLPGLLGKQARYSMPLVPVIFLLAGLGAQRLIGRFGAGRRLVVVAFALLAAVTVVARPHCVLAQEWLFRTRSVASVLSTVPAGARIAAYHGFPAELAWLLPGRRVLALPFKAERVDSFLRDYPPDVIVLPMGEGDPGTPEGRDAVGLSGLLELERRRAFLPEVGVTMEAESDPPGLHAFRIVCLPGRPFLARFGFHMDPRERGAAQRALEAGAADPMTREILLANPPR